MYDAVPDPYCYPNSTVLKNIPGLTNRRDLEQFELAMTAQRAQEIFPSGRLSSTHYRAFHKHLFQDVYKWAGKYRTVRISKGESTFCYPEHVPREMKRLFQWLKQVNYLRHLDLDDFASGLAVFLGDLNAIHPFRDGNGRTQLSFAALIALRARHPLALDQIVPTVFLAAMIQNFHGNNDLLIDEIRTLAE